jgi:hypothetical protein
MSATSPSRAGWGLIAGVVLASLALVLAILRYIREDANRAGPDPFGPEAAKPGPALGPNETVLVAPSSEPRLPARGEPSTPEPNAPAEGMSLELESQRHARMLDRMNQRAVVEHWAEQYSGFSAEEILGQRDALEDAIHEESRDYFEAQFAQGNYQVFDELDPLLLAGRKNPFLIAWLRFEPGVTTVMRVVLPEEFRPELYEIRELSTWLATRARALAPPMTASSQSK